MNKEQEEENRQLQEDEITALECIFPDSFKRDASSPDAFMYTLNLDEGQVDLRSPRKLVLRFFLPPTYPNQDMPIYEISSIYCGTKKIDNDMMDAIDAGFQSLFQPTEVVLYEWISWLTDYLEEHVKPVSDEEPVNNNDKLTIPPIENLDLQDHDYDPPQSDLIPEVDDNEEDEAHDRPTVRSLMGPNAYHHESPPKIFSSEPLLDRKSSFIAHIAQVHNVHEVKVVVAHLLQNKKIAKATHNILAYRITMPDGKVLQDNDDDGESAAGGRLSHLMQILEVENVVVVVTRWFGGIHLGPDRFKDINNVARKALDECGYINDKHVKNKQQHKKNNNHRK